MARDRRKKPKHLFFQGRHWFVLVCLVMGTIALAVRGLYVQVIDNDVLHAEGLERQVRVLKMVPARGKILDRRGHVLAVSTPVDAIWAHPASLRQARADWPRLADTLGMETADIDRILERNINKGFVYIKRSLSPALATHVVGLGVRGVARQREYHRYYPAGRIAGHVLGFTDVDDKGQEGAELTFENHLGGVAGQKRVRRDRRGQTVENLDQLSPVHHGRELRLSIDVRIQAAAHQALARTLVEHEAVGGTAMVLDSRTGEILAMVNLPEFNPNDRSTFNTHVMRNRAVTDIFEPGSTVKPFTLSLALQSGIFTPDTQIPTSPGVLVLNRHRIRDIHDYGVLSLTNVLVKSSNIGTAKIALELNPSQLVATLQSVGFGRLTGVELPGERSGVLQSKERWRLSEHATLSYGYGLSVTALQLARAYMVLANGGVLKPITIRRREELPRGERVLPSDVVGQINQMLEHVVVKGTGKSARLPSYRVAGKTGTVRKINPEGGYLEGHWRALFAGFAPANDPQFVAVVMIDDPRGEFYYGGEVAAPVFRDIMATALRLYSIPGDIEPEGREVVVTPQSKQSGA